MNDSDANVYNAMGDCTNILYDTCTTWGRLGGQLKEKYGTLRFYANFSPLNLHTLIYPAYYYIQFPKWLADLDYKVIGPVLNFFFGTLFYKYRVFMYRRGYKKCLEKYPQYREEILDCADFSEYLNGL